MRNATASFVFLVAICSSLLSSVQALPKGFISEVVNPRTKGKVFLVGDIVEFDGSTSFDPDGGELLFQWDFGDGNDSTTNVTSPSHAYDEPGKYTVILVVSNSNGQAHLASTTVVVGKPPTASIISPAEGDFFSAGEVLNLNGEAYDYLGKRLADDQLKWEVRRYDADNFVFVMEKTSGNNFDLYPPKPDDRLPSEFIFLRVFLFATDNNGITTKIVRDVYPKNVPVSSFADVDNANITTVTFKPIFCLVDNASCNGTATSCCSGYCNEKGFCVKGSKQDARNDLIVPTESPSMVVQVPISGYTNETDVDSRPTSNEEESEPPRKPFIPENPNFTEDDTKTSLASHDSELDKKSGKDNASEGASGTWLTVILIVTLIIVAFIFCWKYIQLKFKIENELRRPSSDEFQQRSAPSKIAIAEETTCTSTDLVDSDETGVSIGISSISSRISDGPTSKSSASFCSSAAIWRKIAEETERRSKLRAKYSTRTEVAPTTPPRTPETIETTESPSNLEVGSSPSRVLPSNIDDTLVRLDDLLSKCFTRKRTRNVLKNELQCPSSEEGVRKDRPSNIDVKEASDDCNLDPNWHSSSQVHMPGTPLKEKTFSMASLLLAESPPNACGSEALHLPDLSNTSRHSLLIFQDNDLSLSNRETSTISNSTGNDDLIESSMVRDGDKNTMDFDRFNSHNSMDSCMSGEIVNDERQLSDKDSKHLDQLESCHLDKTTKSYSDILAERHLHLDDETDLYQYLGGYL